MKYKKKPIEVEAEQWFPGKQILGVEEHSYNTIIRTLEGDHIVTPGDWIITGLAGEKYACKDAIFRATYEPVIEEKTNMGLPIPEDLEEINKQVHKRRKIASK